MRNKISNTFWLALFSAIAILGSGSCSGRSTSGDSNTVTEKQIEAVVETEDFSKIKLVTGILVSPENPRPGEIFRVMVAGGKDVLKADIRITSPSGKIKATKSRSGVGLPFWKIEEFTAGSAGEYQAEMGSEKINFKVTDKSSQPATQSVWKVTRSWDAKSESLYSAWVNALFCNANESTSWKSLNEVTEMKDWNFLYNHLSLDEDNPSGKNKVVMQPDCADNPYFLRAYFAWKLGLPFGFHESDRGALGRAPGVGRWITNETPVSHTNSTQKFNAYLRMVANGVHSGTARAAMSNENADYYPVELNRGGLRPGVVYADPYGHTLILVNQLPQSGDQPGVLLSVDAQPDKTIAIKRFWKGNFLFETSGVIGEPGFKAFRPIEVHNGGYHLLKSGELNEGSGHIPFSLQQKGMKSEDFYHAMERVINPKPLDPETAMLDLIKALHEQLTVRVNSVETGEKYMRAHPGTVIPMPTRPTGVFQTGGVWEDFSTPNRDLRLLIAIDAVIDFPAKVLRSPEDYKMPKLKSAEAVKSKLDEILKAKMEELSITYIRSNGSEQKLTLAEILKRRAAFEIAYNPNDGPEIRWGAPQGSAERSTCKRQVPPAQAKVMNETRAWFHKRLHPPT
ncbi:MAG TPA: hypothetical protein PKO30_15080 [Prolixibacteraceae bacterium]|nr:hypothetical protein [Prolixibacteraceae bacterium]